MEVSAAMRIQRLLPKLTLQVANPASIAVGEKASAYVEVGNDGDAAADVSLVPDLPNWLSLQWGTQTIPAHKSLGCDVSLDVRGLGAGPHQHELKFTYISPSGATAELAKPIKFSVVASSTGPRPAVKRAPVVLPLPVLFALAIVLLLGAGLWYMLHTGGGGRIDVAQRLVRANQCVAMRDWQGVVNNLEKNGEPIAAENQEVIWL
ncbi:MAG: hypothetical protein KKI08_21100, partial [Armatimonadetes bacterium]|nr:hypothetical protein [Armatimonadota bacterium]